MSSSSMRNAVPCLGSILSSMPVNRGRIHRDRLRLRDRMIASRNTIEACTPRLDSGSSAFHRAENGHERSLHSFRLPNLFGSFDSEALDDFVQRENMKRIR